MSRVEWAFLCDLAYFDAYRNLCVIGVQTQPVPNFPVGTRRFAIAARVPGLAPHPKVTVSVSTPDSTAGTPTACEYVRVEAVGDFLLVTFGLTPLIDDGIYRFEVAVPSPSVAIDLPIVIGDRRSHANPLSDGHRVDTPRVALPLRGINHVGLG
jgi:hypothetical protein